MPASTLACSVTDPPAPNASAQVVFHGSTGEQRIELAGAQTRAVDMSMLPLPGAKGFRFVYEERDADNAAVTAPVSLTFTVNSNSLGPWPLSPGSWFGFADPTPIAGMTGVSITTTANAVLRVLAIG